MTQGGLARSVIGWSGDGNRCQLVIAAPPRRSAYPQHLPRDRDDHRLCALDEQYREGEISPCVFPFSPRVISMHLISVNLISLNQREQQDGARYEQAY